MALWPNNRRDLFAYMSLGQTGYLAIAAVSGCVGTRLTYFANENIVAYSSVPEGMFGSRACIIPPIDAGGMAADTAGEGDVSDADGWAVKLATAAIGGSGELTATGSLIVQLIAALTGTGGVSNADIKAFLQLAAALTGTGSVSATATGLGALIASLTGSGTTAGSTATGTGALSADIVVTGSGLTTAGIASAVWAAIATANDDPGTMGEKLNDAGGASNPWTEVIESGYTAAQILRLIAAAVQGDATGLENGSPTFKGLDGTTDRIEATYSSGTRTVTNRDAD